MNRTEQNTVLEAFRRVLGQELHNIRERPDILWQQMYNRLQWVDGEERIINRILELHKHRYKKPWFRLLNKPMQEAALIRTFIGHTESVTSCDFSFDGKHIISASEDGTLRLWDVRTGEEKLVLKGHEDGVVACAFCRNGRNVVSSSRDKTVRIWDLKASREKAVLRGHTGTAECCVLSPDGKMIASSGDWEDNTVRIWDTNTGNQLAVYHLNGDKLACHFSNDSKLIIAGARDLFIKKIRAEKGQKIKTIKKVAHRACDDISIRPDGLQFLVAAGLFNLSLYDFKKCKEVAEMKIPGGYDDDYYVNSCVFSPDGSCFVAGVNEAIRKYDASSHEELSIYKGHSGHVNACSFSPDGKFIVSASSDKTLKLWNAESLGDSGEFEGHKRAVGHCSFSPDGKTIISTGEGGSCSPFLLRGKEKYDQITPIGGGDLFGFDASFSPDGWLAAIVGKLKGMRVYKVGTKELFYFHPFFSESGADLCHCVFSPDGSLILTSYYGSELPSDVSGSLKKWNWKLVLFDLFRHSEIVLGGHEYEICDCGFSPDGRKILSASADSTIKIWNIETLQEIKTFIGHIGPVNSCSYSQDGKYIASGGDDCTLRVWNLESGKKCKHWKGHENGVSSCVISPDGKKILSGGKDGNSKLWDIDTTQELAILQGLLGSVTDCAFNADGRKIVLGDERGQVLVFNLENIIWHPAIATPYRQNWSLNVRCPYCQTRIRIKKSKLGRIIACTSCNQPVKLNNFCLARPVIEWRRESVLRRLLKSIPQVLDASLKETHGTSRGEPPVTKKDKVAAEEKAQQVTELPPKPRPIPETKQPETKPKKRPAPSRAKRKSVWLTRLIVTAMSILMAGGGYALTRLSPWLWLLGGPLILFAVIFFLVALTTKLYHCPHCGKAINSQQITDKHTLYKCSNCKRSFTFEQLSGKQARKRSWQ